MRISFMILNGHFKFISMQKKQDKVSHNIIDKSICYLFFHYSSVGYSDVTKFQAYSLPSPRASLFPLFKFFIPLDNDIEAVIEFLELFKGTGGGVWPKKKLKFLIWTYFHIWIMGKQMLFTESEKNILVPRYDLSKSAVFCDFFAKCIGNPGILGIWKFASKSFNSLPVYPLKPIFAMKVAF